MEVTTITPGSSLNKLKCASCSNYLSYFPIRVCSNNQNICGRCSPPDDQTVIQNVVFEILSQFLKFPCRFKDQGCDEELQPKKVPEHEKLCPFRVIACPLKKQNGCKWCGPRPETLHHCRNEHKSLFLREEVTVLHLPSNEESYHLLENENCLLIFEKSFDCSTKVLQFQMYATEAELRPPKFSCRVSVHGDEKSLSCDFVTTTFDEISLNELKLHSLMEAKLVTLKVTILEALQDPSRVLNLDMLSVLKCFQCSDYAVPPIYNCLANSETLCSDCRISHGTSCISCSRTNTTTRSISLDKMANKLNYPCKYQSNGCTFISKPDVIKSHQSACELGDLACPIGEFEACHWKGPFRNLEKHIQNNHQELVTNSAHLTKRLRPQQMKCDIIKFSGRLFRLTCVKEERRYLWAVQAVGMCQDDYKYEIEIVDPKGKGRRLLVRQQCGALTKREELFKRGGFCYFMKDQIDEFVVEGVITFKVHIFV